MTRIGILSNPRSQRNKRRMESVRGTLSAAGPSATHIELEHINEIPKALHDLARQKVDLLVVNGGDGTVQAVMTSLINLRPFDFPPPLAVAPAGMTNLIAAGLGLPGRREKALSELLAKAEMGALTFTERPVLTLAANAADPGVHGMFAGAAAFHDAVIWSRQEIHKRGAKHNLAIGLAIANLALGGFLGTSKGHPLVTGTQMRIALDEAVPEKRELFLLLATTLNRLLLGMMPFWEEQELNRTNAGQGALRVTTIDYPPKRLLRALVPVLRGRPSSWMKAAGYRSGHARRLSIACSKPIVFDGEFYCPSRFGLPADAPLVLEHRHNLRFIG